MSSVIDRIERSELAVIRTGLIQTHSAALSSVNLPERDEEKLLALLLQGLIVSPDAALRRASCRLASTRLQIRASTQDYSVLHDLPVLARQLEFHLRSQSSAAVKRDLVEVLVSLLHRADLTSRTWCEALCSTPSLLECVALDVALSPAHLAMSRQLSNYPDLRALQLMRDSFFRRLFELLDAEADASGPGCGALQDLRCALLQKLADGDVEGLDELEEQVASSSLSLLKQLCMGSRQVCTLAARTDQLVMHWRRLLLVRRRPSESQACLELLECLMLQVELPELERVWLKHDLGCAFFEMLSADTISDNVLLHVLALITRVYSDTLPFHLLTKPLKYGVGKILELGKAIATAGNRRATCAWLSCISSLMPFIHLQDLNSVIHATAYGFKFHYDSEVLHLTWCTLAKAASNEDTIMACPLFLQDPAHNIGGTHADHWPLLGSSGGSGVLGSTLEVMRGCERDVVLHTDAMISMLQFLSTMLRFLVQSMPGKVNAEHKLEQLLAGLRNVVLPRLMQHYHDLHEEVVSSLFGILATAMEEVPHFAETFALEACALGFVGTCIRFLEESSADQRDPVVHFTSQLLLGTGTIEAADTLQCLSVLTLESLLVEVLQNGCDTEHAHAFVDASAALLAATLVHDDVPCDEGLASKWAVYVSSTAFPWTSSSALNLLIVLMELDRRRGPIDVHTYVVERIFLKIDTQQMLRCPELMVKLVRWLSCAKYERQLAYGLLSLWAESRATDAGRQRLEVHEPMLFSTFVKSPASTETLLLLLKHPNQAIRLSVASMVETFVKGQRSDITMLLRCGLLPALFNLLPDLRGQEEARDMGDSFDASVCTRADNVEPNSGTKPCFERELIAGLDALTAVVWHPDCGHGLEQPTTVLQIGQWCEGALRSKLSCASSGLEYSDSDMRVCRSILVLLGGVNSKMLAGEYASSFVTRHHELLQELLETPLKGHTCSLILLLVPAVTGGGQSRSADFACRRCLLPPSFFHALLKSTSSLLRSDSLTDRAIAIAGVCQLFLSSDEWAPPSEDGEDEDAAGDSAESSYHHTLAKNVQESFVMIQQALVDDSWPLCYRLQLPSLLAAILSSAPYGEDIASQEWNLEIGRWGVSKVADLALSSSRLGSLDKAQDLEVWLSFMRVMIQFKARWMRDVVTDEFVNNLVCLTRACLEHRSLFAAAAQLWTDLAAHVPLSDKQREGLQQIMSRAFEATGQDDVLISRVALTSDDASLCSGTLPAFLVMRLLDQTKHESAKRNNNHADAIAQTRSQMRMLALLLQEHYTPTLPACRTPSGVARRSSRPSPGPVWAIEDMCGSLHVLDPARRFTLGRSQKCNIRVQPSFGSVSAVHACIHALSPNKWELQDRSTVGTLVHSTLLLGAHTILEDGDTFHLGGLQHGATFVMRCLNVDVGYSDWKWKNTDQEAAAAHAAAAAVATEKKEKKERVKEEAAVAARSMALSQAFRETLRHTGALHQRAVPAEDNSVLVRRTARLGTADQHNTNGFDDLLARTRDNKAQDTEESRAATALSKRILLYASGIYAAPQPPEDPTIPPQDLIKQFSRRAPSRPPSRPSSRPLTYSAAAPSHTRAAEVENQAAAAAHTHTYTHTHSRADTGHTANLHVHQARAGTPAMPPRAATTRAGDKDNCTSHHNEGNNTADHWHYSLNFATSQTRSHQDGSWALCLDPPPPSPASRFPAATGAHEAAAATATATRPALSPANPALLQAQEQEAMRQEAMQQEAMRTQAAAAAEDAQALALLSDTDKRAVSKREKAKLERDESAYDHAFLLYILRQEQKQREAKEMSKKRHHLVVQGERERAAAGDKIYDDEDRRLMYVAQLVQETVKPFHSPAQILQAKKKDKAH